MGMQWQWMGTRAQAIHNKRQVKHVSRALTCGMSQGWSPKVSRPWATISHSALAEAMNLIQLHQQGRRSGPSPQPGSHGFAIICHVIICNFLTTYSKLFFLLSLSRHRDRINGKASWGDKCGRNKALCARLAYPPLTNVWTQPPLTNRRGPRAMRRLKLVGPMCANPRLIKWVMGWGLSSRMEVLWVNLVKHGLVSLNLISGPIPTIGLVLHINLVFTSKPIIGAIWVGGLLVARSKLTVC